MDKIKYDDISTIDYAIELLKKLEEENVHLTNNIAEVTTNFENEKEKFRTQIRTIMNSYNNNKKKKENIDFNKLKFEQKY